MEGRNGRRGGRKEGKEGGEEGREGGKEGREGRRKEGDVKNGMAEFIAQVGEGRTRIQKGHVYRVGISKASLRLAGITLLTVCAIFMGCFLNFKTKAQPSCPPIRPHMFRPKKSEKGVSEREGKEGRGRERERERERERGS
jgi:hypothetical protein